jgi:hypothetical protein
MLQKITRRLGKIVNVAAAFVRAANPYHDLVLALYRG